MRCPKCHYISYDSGDRCRNCGYEFALAPAETRGLDLPIQTGDAPVGPLDDLDLKNLPASRPKPESPSTGRDAAPAGRPITASDLPLFSERAPVEETPRMAGAAGAAAPRAPLAVRRSNPPLVRTRSRSTYFDEPTLDLGGTEPEPGPRAGREPPAGAGDRQPDEEQPAPLVRRAGAGIIDATILLSIHTSVVYLTMKVCGVALHELHVLPPVPLVGFLLFLAGGYLVSFTAACGQTLGKMAAGIRVVPAQDADDGSGRVPVGSAVVRAAAMIVSVLPAGLGLIPAVLSADHRTLHDRLAGTRVVTS